MAITKREKSFKDELIQTSYEYLYRRLKNPRTKDTTKEKIAIAMAKAGITSHLKHDLGDETLKGLAGFMKAAGQARMKR